MARSSASVQRGHPGVAYDTYYDILDLPPGASLPDVEDRARLLCTAFQVEGLPPALQQAATCRADAIEQAAQELRLYWRMHRKQPPSAARPQLFSGAGSALVKLGAVGLACALALLVYYGADRFAANAANNLPPVGATPAAQPELMTALPRPLGAFAQPEARYAAPR